MKVDSKTHQILEKIVDNSPVAMFQLKLSPEGKTIFPYISKVIEKIYPNAKQDIFQENPSKYLVEMFPEDFDRLLPSLKSSQQNLSDWHFEFRVREDEYNFRWLQAFASPENNQDGSTIWHGYFKNITIQKLNSEASKLKELRFSSIIENFSEGFALLNPVGEISEISISGKKILGYSENETLAYIQSKLTIHPEDYELIANTFIQSLENPSIIQQAEFRFQMPDGNYRWVETIIHNLLDNPAVQAIVLNFRDINERVLAKIQKEFDSKNLKSLIDNTSEIVWSVDTSFRLISFNSAFEKLIKDYSGQDLYTGKNILETLEFSQTHLDLYTSYYTRSFKGETFTEQYNISRIKDLWREVSFYPIKIDNKIIGTACYGKDITQRKHFEMTQQKTNEQLLAAQNLARLGYWKIDLQGENHFWSDEMYNIFEYGIHQSIPNLEEALTFIHPDDREDLLNKHSLMIDEGKYINTQLRIILPNGKMKYLVMNAKIISDEDGKNSQIRITSQDITERKKVENEVVENEKRFKALIANSTEGIAIIDVDGKIQEISPSGKRIFGLNPNDNISRFEENIIHNEDIEAIYQTFATVIKNPSFSPTSSFRYFKPTGEEIWIETNFNNQLNEPSINGIILNFRDITERKKTEQLLSKEQGLLRTIIDNLPLNVYVKDINARKILANKAEWEFVGAKSEKEILGKTDFELFDKEYVVSFIQEDQQVLELGESIINKETYTFNDVGQKCWYLVSKIPLRNEENQIEGLLGLSINITEQKLVQEQLRESEIMFRDLAKSVPGVVFQLCVEPDGRMYFPYLSSKVEEIFGITFDFEQWNLAKHVYDEDKKAFITSIAEAIQKRSVWSFEGRIHNKKGELKWFHGISNPTTKNNRLIYSGLLIDISERKNAEEDKKHLRQLELSLEKEKEINLLKSRFISFASHEFRTPLATIVTSIDILGIYTNMMNNIDLKEKIQYHLKRVLLQSNRLTEMLTDVLLLEKAANDKINLQLEHINLVDLINDINVQYYSERKDNRKLELKLPAENKIIFSDASLLNHIINNLIDNAFKYSRDAENPYLKLIFNDNNFNIIIRDFGIGIPEDDQKHLFEIFFRANNVLNIEGTGLGLNITKEFTHKLGGEISFTSVVGKGTEFTLTFPNQYC